MYVKGKNYVTYFENKEKKEQSTDKLLYGRVSETIKSKDKNGADVVEYENWNARFVGKAREKANSLVDKQRISLTEFNVRNPYNKDKKKSYPYIMVIDFEIEQTEN